MSPHSAFKTISVPAGTILFEQGQKATAAYIIKKGMVRIFRQEEKGKMELAVFRQRQIFGEMALFFNTNRGAGAITIEDCELLVVDGDSLQQAVKSCKPIVQSLLNQLLLRLKEKQQLLEGYMADDGLEGRLLRMEQSRMLFESTIGCALADESQQADAEWQQLLGNLLVVLNNESQEEGGRDAGQTSG